MLTQDGLEWPTLGMHTRFLRNGHLVDTKINSIKLLIATRTITRLIFTQIKSL